MNASRTTLTTDTTADTTTDTTTDAMPGAATGPVPGADATGSATGSATADRPGPFAAWAPRLQRAAARCTGAALALAAALGGAADRFGPAAPVAATALALWAAVPPEAPAARPLTWAARLTEARTTVLATGCVLLAALGEPPFWRALAVTVLLVGHLLLLDVLGPHGRVLAPARALVAVASSCLVLPVAFAPTAAGEWSRPIALLGLFAAAWGVGLALWPHRHRRPRRSGTQDRDRDRDRPEAP
ncbi:hypothetical protein ACFWOG_21945 [Kitasatospora sp. NPDC058406]|uniref:hypothetical protein n=1 Tax=Kitasatospora sp. NPDC058406 TaxID=3346483 RepID=UPI0036461914